ncbi:ATP synthase subunit gamma, mitochondrial-like isoform X2 [Plodia interpunctella]|uniref:ATP synthase subunit gamma, mitochondrial-like isoform X2 n=1 Tax=Plodia interpunctella TaxID=58824 RepID=UPI002368EA49|nr:ATP synthase subunit gamma, mitochondrial-like isoform X2 [Plodia interpunctella]
MVQLKQVSLRLKSISNIQKITKTMKMVSASKFTRAERELQAARPFGYGPRKFYESSHLVKGAVDAKKGDKDAAAAAPPPEPAAPDKDDKDAKKLRRLYIAMTSDRGLCGGVHSGVARRIRREMAARGADGANHKLVCVGDKSRTMLRRAYAESMLASVKDAAPNMSAFDDVDDDQLECYAEWTLAALLYYALKESAASEQSARMAAMDNATKNAGEMIRKLTLLFNRTRQAVITRELIEIISGAAALK